MVELAPGAAHAFYAAGLTSEITNRPREAIEVLQRINTKEGWGKSWAPRVYNLIARSYHQLGDYQHDLEWAKQLRASEPNVGWTRLEEVKATAALGRGKEAFDLAMDGASFPSPPKRGRTTRPATSCGSAAASFAHMATPRSRATRFSARSGGTRRGRGRAGEASPPAQSGARAR